MVAKVARFPGHPESLIETMVATRDVTTAATDQADLKKQLNVDSSAKK